VEEEQEVSTVDAFLNAFVNARIVLKFIKVCVLILIFKVILEFLEELLKAFYSIRELPEELILTSNFLILEPQIRFDEIRLHRAFVRCGFLSDWRRLLLPESGMLHLDMLMHSSSSIRIRVCIHGRLLQRGVAALTLTI
jgi:hypothetical protein